MLLENVIKSQLRKKLLNEGQGKGWSLVHIGATWDSDKKIHESVEVGIRLTSEEWPKYYIIRHQLPFSCFGKKETILCDETLGRKDIPYKSTPSLVRKLAKRYTKILAPMVQRLEEDNCQDYWDYILKVPKGL